MNTSQLDFKWNKILIVILSGGCSTKRYVYGWCNVRIHSEDLLLYKTNCVPSFFIYFSRIFHNFITRRFHVSDVLGYLVCLCIHHDRFTYPNNL